MPRSTPPATRGSAATRAPTPLPAERFDGRALGHPEWEPWLAVLRETARAVDDPLWARAVPAVEARPGAAVPVLAGATIALDARAAGRWVHRLFEAAAAGGPGGARLGAARMADAGALVLVEAAVGEDAARLDALAAARGDEAAAFRAVAPLAAVPLLQACGRAWAGRLPQDWDAGYCPVCGAWPTLAETRGLEQARRLRCGRCGGDWRMDWLRCPYCGETAHERLGALVSAAGGETRKVETCAGCRGYVKTLATLQPMPPGEIGLADLATVDLDVAALHHGYGRPPGPGHPLGARVGARPRGRLRAWLP